MALKRFRIEELEERLVPSAAHLGHVLVRHPHHGHHGHHGHAHAAPASGVSQPVTALPAPAQGGMVGPGALAVIKDPVTGVITPIS
jgi:hypothetical protein